jgi:hypothetical protein
VIRKKRNAQGTFGRRTQPQQAKKEELGHGTIMYNPNAKSAGVVFLSAHKISMASP